MFYYLYACWDNNQFHLRYSHNPSLDRIWWQERGFEFFELLTGPVPLGIAAVLLSSLEKVSRKESSFDVNNCRVSIEKLVRNNPFFDSNGLKDCFLVEMPKSPFVKEQVGFESTPSINKVISGRILLPRELVRALEENEILIEHRDLSVEQRNEYLADLMQLMYLQEEVKILPAITFNDESVPICRRCGQSTGVKVIDCIDCGGTCYYCEECLMLGESRICLPLYAAPGNRREDGLLRQRFELKLEFSLTPAQSRASEEARRFTRLKAGDIRPSYREALIWAVCGAGKTEVAFAAIEEALLNGDKVLFAIPRRDVVLELEPRFQKAFPGAIVKALYGGSTEKFGEADIVIATTHQAIRFYQNFDLVILDEADAYPYTGAPMLRYALKRACKPKGKIINMTATPEPGLLAGVKQGSTCLIRIPARHHGHPLPVPEISLKRDMRFAQDKAALPDEVTGFIRQALNKGAQVFVFVPYTTMARPVALWLKDCLGDEAVNSHDITWSHGKDPDRDKKRVSFSRGESRVFVTTSIMERGITVPHAHVLVLWADRANIFDQGALIQMAGRSGRSTAYPGGRVLFLATKKTQAMGSAIKVIREMNGIAAEQGYLTNPQAVKPKLRLAFKTVGKYVLSLWRDKNAGAKG